MPLERVDAVVDLVPETCRRCAHRLHARDDEGDPRRHQVTEVPPIAAHITEYRCHRRHCPACGTRTVAAVPDECAGQFGPQLAALIAYLTVVCRPRLVVQRLLADVLQIPLSLGSTQHAWEEASAAVAASYKELRQALANQPVLNADETGHRTNGAKRWLWTLVAPTFVFYTIATSRGADVLRHLRHGLCRRPGQRPIVDVPDVSRRSPILLGAFPAQSPECAGPATTAAARRFCREALTLQRQLFRLWHRFRGDPRTRGAPLTRAQLVAKVLPIEKCLFALAERYVNAPDVNVEPRARVVRASRPLLHLRA